MADRSIRHDLDQLRQGLDDLRQTFSTVTARLGEAAEEQVSAGRSGFRAVRRQAEEAGDELASRAEEGVGALRDRVEDQPITSILLAFVAGALLASVFAAGITQRR